MISFDLSPEQKELQRTARKFALEIMEPTSLQHDEEHKFPMEIISQAFELGLLNMTIPEAYGGLSLSTLDQVIIGEEMSAGCVGMTTSVIANDLALLPILIGGTEEQKKKFVEPFTQSLRFTSFALTEPNAGSDVAGMSTTITDDGDSYVINGSKM